MSLRELSSFSALWMLVVLAAGSVGCAAADSTELGEPGDPEIFSESLTIWNRSQYDLAELRVHAGERFEGHPNLAESVIETEEHLFLSDFPSGSYITVIRERFEGGEQMAVTTSEPVRVARPGHTLVVFDVSFRLLDPESEDNPFRDGSAETP